MYKGVVPVHRGAGQVNIVVLMTADPHQALRSRQQQSRPAIRPAIDIEPSRLRPQCGLRRRGLQGFGMERRQFLDHWRRPSTTSGTPAHVTRQQGNEGRRRDDQQRGHDNNQHRRTVIGGCDDRLQMAADPGCEPSCQFHADIGTARSFVRWCRYGTADRRGRCCDPNHQCCRRCPQTKGLSNSPTHGHASFRRHRGETGAHRHYRPCFNAAPLAVSKIWLSRASNHEADAFTAVCSR